MVKYDDGKVLIKRTEEQDCYMLAKDLRSEDRVELHNVGYTDMLDIILMSYDVSKDECWTVFYKDKIAMIYGLRKEESDGIIWMLSTNVVRQFPKCFLRLAKQFIDEYKKDNRKLYNFINVENIQSMKLLSYCGAVFHGGFRSNKTGKPFIKFEIMGELDV